MLAVETVDIADKAKISHPLVDPEQVEIGRANEIDRRFVAMKKQTDVIDALERFGGDSGRCHDPCSWRDSLW
jgi:hypothetical protein